MPLALQVLLPLPLPEFDFLLPHDLPKPELGARAVVPWQQGIRLGIVVGYQELRDSKAIDLREVIACFTPAFIQPSRLQLIKDISAYTFTPPGLVLKQFLTVGLNESLQHEVNPYENELGMPSNIWVEAIKFKPEELDFARRQGLLRERVSLKGQQQRVLVPLKVSDASLEQKPQRNQRLALDTLWQRGFADSAAALSREAEVPISSVSALIKKGYADYELRPAPAPKLPQYSQVDLPDVPLELPHLANLSISGGTRLARLAAIMPLLKTDLANGHSVLVLVPEGAFLAETVAALANLLPTQGFSGELSDVQRMEVWHELQEQPTVLVGTYPALMLPLVNLGRVVLLEHGNESYKLLAGSRIFVPIAASFLANITKASLIFSDVLDTPEVMQSLAPEARFSLGDVKPRVHLVNLKESRNWPLSPDLIRVLKQVAERKRQAVILAPRRGFSAALRCADCQHLIICPNCDLPLRYHREVYNLRCHQCAHCEKVPPRCPKCQGLNLGPSKTAGTQWIVDTIKKLLPQIQVLRFDSDKKDELLELYEGEAGILVATTAILRRPPLPNISLIAHTLLDTHFELGDFRAAETGYRLLLNLNELVPGKRPLLLLQGFQVENSMLQAFLSQDKEGFLNDTLARRQLFNYPPFGIMAKIQLSSKRENIAESEAIWLTSALRTQGAKEEELLGPSPAPIFRLKGMYNYHIFVRATTLERLQTLLAPALAYQRSAKLRIDIDPREMFSFLDL